MRCTDKVVAVGGVKGAFAITPAGAPNVYRLPLLTERFCTLLLEELRH